MDYQTGHVMNLANSIIGVGVLAMPYCFKQCGIILSILMLFASSIISRLACHFLLKSAIMARRKTFEFLAFHAFGALGKLIIEIGLIGFLVGTCIAFFVVMGDLGPEIISEITGTKVTSTLRTSVLMALALFCVLPLGLLRNVDSLTSVSKATIGFYCCLVLKIIVASLPRFFSENWFEKVVLWEPKGILQCLPIFSMALFCQTQLFEIYQAMPNASLEKMNNIIRYAVNICTFVYIFVGMFGYIAFFQEPFSGNILLSFKPSVMTDVMKIGFILSVAFSFPLVIFPCRASLYSLLYKNTYPIHEGSSTNYIPEGKFKCLTFFIVFISLVTGVLIPNIELVLGLVGSTIGVMICVLFPAACFICMSPKNTNERILAQVMLFVGVLVMVLGTYANLYAIEEVNYTRDHIDVLKPLNLHSDQSSIKKTIIEKIPHTYKPIMSLKEHQIFEKKEKKILANNEDRLKEIRHEPPQPVEPIDNLSAKKSQVVTVKKEDLSKIISHSLEKDHNKKIKNPDEPLSSNLNFNVEKVEDKQGPVVEPILPEEINAASNILNVNQVNIEKHEPILSKIVNEVLKPNNNKEQQDPVVKPVLPKNDEVKKEDDLKPAESGVPKIQNNNLHIQHHAELKASSPAVKMSSVMLSKKMDEVDIEAIKKEDTELKEQEKEKLKDVAKNQELIDTLQKQNEVQQELVKQQKELIEVIKQQQQALEMEKQQKEIEKLKAAKHIENIAKQAIESLSVKPVNLDDKPANDNSKHLYLNPVHSGGIVKESNVPNPAPLSYQLGLNQNKNVNNESAVQSIKKYMKPNDLPIALALSENSTLIYKKSPANLMGKKMNNLPNDKINKVIQKSDDLGKVISENLSAKQNIHNFEKEPIKNENTNLEEGQPSNKKENEVSNKVNQNLLNKEEAAESFKRDLLSRKSESDRQKREVELLTEDSNKVEVCDKTNDKVEVNTDSTLIKIISKLSDPELVTIDVRAFALNDQNAPVKPIKRDLKSV